MNRLMFAVLAVALFAPTSGRAVDAQTVPDRLERLEREVAALKRQAPARPAGFSGKPGPPGERGEKGDPGPPGSVRFPLSLESPKGKMLLWVGSDPAAGGRLVLGTDKGIGTVELLGAQGGAGGFSLFKDPVGRKRAFLGSAGKDGRALLELYDDRGASGVSIAVEPGGTGRLNVNGGKVQDYAEVFAVATRQGVEPGTVMAAAGEEGTIAPSTTAYDRRVVGVISGAGGLQPGSVIGSREDGSNDLPVAVSGQVYVRVGLEGGPIAPGDLLVASSRPGVAMRAADPNRAQGAVVGKALGSFGPDREGEGLVRMMVMLR